MTTEVRTHAPTIGTAAHVGTTGVHYELFVRAFADSNHDGIGDLNGVTQKLDYLRDLGISAIWLMPVNPSPTYHKYDITDYYGIDPDYGTLDDFRRLIHEAHKRGIAVLMDLVIHHTSIKHHWFTEAAKGPDNPYRSFYKWMLPDEIKRRNLATRDITADSDERSPWHYAPGTTRSNPATEKYYGMFWSGMPDLNFDHQPLREEIYNIVRYWLTDIGVDGFRLDAARHLYREAEEPKNHQFWDEFGQVVQAAKPGAYLVGEVWTRPNKVAPYFRGLQANFNFDLALELEAIIRQGDDENDVMAFLYETQAAYGEVNDQFIDALILSNHDQNRIGSLLKGDLNKLKVAANLLLTLPGNPYLYYGEEIGMLGLKPDEYIREPFIWNVGKKDSHRARWTHARYSTSRTVRPLAHQQTDPDSLFTHYKQLIAFRNGHAVLNDNRSRLQLSGIRQKGIVSFGRQNEHGLVWFIQNLTNSPIDVVLSAAEQAAESVQLATVPGTLLAEGTLTLPAFGLAVIS
ncbi:alpha-amylase family glycosyl hydrolase [Fibrella forsythiae]|uniref:Alpha-amylase n=1 Tax=Fibrella forsythiae TaxID=2817061 RepID=A0ABS3JC95_9BACT|nr:alpha-amylase family glycosyl hydrolase [Fibrella forsythiae]MBO0947621.1 alpha-amylase [Fibrella forsythiae]